MSDRIQNFREAAPILDKLTPQPGARVYFECMSGALVWSDEYPFIPDGVYEGDVDLFPRNVLRGLWAYRTSLIEQKPRETFREAWELAQSLFPNWPGFLPERRDPFLRDVLEREREKTGDPFEELEQRWQAQQSAKTVKAS